MTSKQATAGRQGGGPRSLHPPPRKDADPGRGTEPAHPPRAAAHAAARRHCRAAWTSCKQQLAELRATGAPADKIASVRHELRETDASHARKPGQPASPHASLLRGQFTRIRERQARTLQRQPAAGGFDRQEVPQPRPELPGPHPGRQHGPDAGGRQVRVSPRLQVLAPTPRGGFARRSPGRSPIRPARSGSRST